MVPKNYSMGLIAELSLFLTTGEIRRADYWLVVRRGFRSAI